MQNLLSFRREFPFWGLSVLLLLALSCGFNPAAQPAGWSGAAISSEGVYAGSREGRIVAFDPRTGEVKWRFPTSDKDIRPIYGTPAVMNDVVYFGGGDKKVHALKAETGQQIWEFDTKDIPLTDITLTSDIVLVASTDYIYAIKPDSGDRAWIAEIKGKIYSAPVTDGSKVYVGTMSGKVIALNLANGKIAWSFPPNSDSSYTTGGFASSPTIFKGKIFIGSFNRTFYALDVTTGAVKWQQPVGNWVWNKAVVFDDTVFVGSMDHKVYAFDVSTGAKKWDFLADNAIRADPALDKDSMVLIVGDTGGKVYGLNISTGLPAWEKKLEASIMAPISIANGVAYVPTMDNNLYTLETKNGKLLWNKVVARGEKG